MSISNRYNRLLNRRAPSQDRTLQKFAESYESVLGEYTKYLVGAIKPVDNNYTKKLIEQGDRVENQLQTRTKDTYTNLEFRRQGSVSNNTHIKYYSDVDVLVIIDKFITLEEPQVPTNPYKGEPKNDLLELREKCYNELNVAFPKVVIDNSGSTALSLKGGSLICKVDVVPSNWYDTNDYAKTKLEYLRGIMVLDKEKMERIKNAPFLFNNRINEKDNQCNGAVRMLVRLLKTLKADAEESNQSIDFSSYDICSSAYRIPNEYLKFQLNEPLDIIRNFLLWMKKIIDDGELRKNLKVVDDSRTIFNESNKLNEFTKLYADLLELYNGASKENQLKLLTEAHLK